MLAPQRENINSDLYKESGDTLHTHGYSISHREVGLLNHKIYFSYPYLTPETKAPLSRSIISFRCIKGITEVLFFF